MRVALHSEIKTEMVGAYVERHQSVPLDLVATFDRVGISDWVIWRSGTRLFHVVECDDWDRAVDLLMTDPANLSWQSDIGRFVELFRDAGGEEGLAPLEPVWSLSAQVARSGS